MKRMVTTSLVIVGLLAASSALALDMQVKTPISDAQRGVHQMSPNALFACDNNVQFNAYYQLTDARYGNKFTFPAGSMLSTLTFTHNGYGLVGPYDYNFEVWDFASCTKVAARNGLSAADAEVSSAVENVDLCASGIILSGEMVMAIDPNTCPVPDDCYPDVMFSNQTAQTCKVIIATADTAPACLPQTTGPFLLRVSTNACQVPTQHGSWGQLKSIYR